MQNDRDWKSRVSRYLYRPFDPRYVYWTDAMVDWPRPDLERLMRAPDQIALCITRFNRQRSSGYFFVTRVMADFHCLDTAGDSMNLFPLRVAATNELQLSAHSPSVNFSSEFREAYRRLLGSD